MTTEDGDTFKFVRDRGKLCLLLGDTLYEVTRWLRNGAEALVSGVPYYSNPHRDGSHRHGDWNNGHELAQDAVLAHYLGGDAVDQLATAGLVEEDWDEDWDDD